MHRGKQDCFFMLSTNFGMLDYFCDQKPNYTQLILMVIRVSNMVLE